MSQVPQDAKAIQIASELVFLLSPIRSDLLSDKLSKVKNISFS